MQRLRTFGQLFLALSIIAGVAMAASPAAAVDKPYVIMWEHANFKGNSLRTGNGLQHYDLSLGDWNDRISSVHVHGNVRMCLYTEANYRGAAIITNPGKDIYIGDLSVPDGIFNDSISSYRPALWNGDSCF